jgi:hypothetical protein
MPSTMFGKSGKESSVGLNSGELIDAWKMLSAKNGESSGIFSIPLDIFDEFRISIAIVYPEKHETLLFEFKEKTVGFYLSGLELTGLVFHKNESLKSPVYNQVFVLSKQEDQDLTVFNTICSDLLTFARQNNKLSGEIYFNAIKNRLNVWIEFLKNGDGKYLSLRKQIGVIGELVLLDQLKKYSPSEITWMNSWKGPEKHSKDFVTQNIAFEIKSILNDEVAVQISNIDQLDTTNIDKLILSIFQFLEDSENGKTINHFVDSIISKISCDKTLRLFLTKLGLSGYYLHHQKHYGLKFSLINEHSFSVDSDFPRLIKNNVAEEISSVKYKLDLSRLSNFKVELTAKIKDSY